MTRLIAPMSFRTCAASMVVDGAHMHAELVVRAVEMAVTNRRPADRNAVRWPVEPGDDDRGDEAQGPMAEADLRVQEGE